MKLPRWTTTLAMVLILGSALALAAPPPKVGILVVSRKSDAAMEARAKDVATRIYVRANDAGVLDKLPIVVYHFDVPYEKQHCEQDLQIQADQLIFVGVVQMTAQNVVEKVLFRMNNASDPETDAEVVFLRAQRALGMAPSTDPNSTAPPGPSHIRTSETTNAVDGSVLVLIPPGTFTMGSDNEASDEKPAHKVTLAAYYIGKFLVTNLQFSKFVTATNYDAGKDWQHRMSTWGDDAPVVDVSWQDAVAYCNWAGLRLPTEAEFEKAARGPDGRKFPWGNDWDPVRCQNGVDGAGNQASPVAGHPSGASPYGCLDMAGNVWEWCSTKYKVYPYSPTDGRENPAGDDARVLRGGSWQSSSIYNFTAGYRHSFAPDNRLNNFGFRVAKTR